MTVDLYRKLYFDMLSPLFRGHYKEYRKAKKVYASFAVKNFDLIMNTQLINKKINVPLFSKQGLKILKIALLNMVSRKSHDEKLLSKMIADEKLKRKYDIKI